MVDKNEYEVSGPTPYPYKPVFPLPPTPKEKKTNPDLPYEVWNSKGITVGAFWKEELAVKICEILNNA